MDPKSEWRSRARCARSLMMESFTHGMGRAGIMARVEPRLGAAVQDLLSHPGSLVRATIAYLIGLETGLHESAARAIGCGIEYLHTASLVFDDFPSMDDAWMRRGTTCLHVVHGEAVATLAALALINRGYALLWQGIQHGSLHRRQKAGQWIDSKLGILGVTGGQAWDLHGWRGEQSAAEVSEVAARKTADLLRLCMVLPAIAGHGTVREIQLLDRLALLRGLAYQAADDLKDVFTHEDSSGKTGGRDEKLGRPNLVTAEGEDAVRQRFGRLISMGDRVQQLLPGGHNRWEMLHLLRVPMPATMLDSQQSLSAVV